MRIVLVGSKCWPEYAGAAYRILNTYSRLLEKHDNLMISILTGSVEFAWPARYTWHGRRVWRLACPLPHLGGRFGRAVSAFRQHVVGLMTLLALACRRRPDVIHVYGSSGVTAAAILWARIRRIPLMIELVTDGARPWQTLPGLRYENRLRLAHGTVITAISRALGAGCAERGLVDNVWVRPNPIDTSRFQPADDAGRAAARAALGGVAEDDVVLSSVAKFMPQKNQAFLVPVLARLPERFKLVLAGPLVEQGPLAKRDTAYLADIEREIDRLGLAHRCRVRPGFADAAEIMRASDVFLMPSTQEGLGTPMLESIACATPVVANADVAAFTQWILDGRNGFLRPLDADAWAEAVQRATELPRACVLKQAETVRRQWAAEIIDRQFHALLRCLAGSPVETRHDIHAILEACDPSMAAAESG